MTRWLLIPLLCLIPALGLAQNFGNIKPRTVIGNSDSTASKPAAPIPFGDVANPVGVDIRQHGGSTASPDNTAAIQAAINEAKASGLNRVIFPAGTYTVLKSATVAANGNPVALMLDAPSGKFSFDGNGAVIKMGGASSIDWADIIHVQNAAAGSMVEFNDLDLDYVNPPFAQGQLTAKTACVANANGSAMVHVTYGTPAWTDLTRIDERDPASLLLAGRFVKAIIDRPTPSPTIVSASGGNYTITFNGAAACTGLAAMTVNNWYSLINKQFGPNCIALDIVQDYKLNNTHCITTSGNGFLVTGARDGYLVNTSGTRYAPGAWQTTTGGAFSVIYQTGKIVTDDTVSLLGSGDDAFFAAPYQIGVASVANTTNITLAGQPYVNVGDTLQFVDPNGARGSPQTAVVSSKTVTTNTAVVLATPAPAAISASWFVYNQSQAPNLCQINGGIFGETPTRGIAASCRTLEVSDSLIQNTGGAGVINEYGEAGGVGFISSHVSLSNVTTSYANYNNLNPAALTVQGWKPGTNQVATTGQIASVKISGNGCYNTGSSCIYVSAATNVSISNNTSYNWQTAAAVPPGAQFGSGTLYQYAIALYNNSNVYLGPNNYIPSSPSHPRIATVSGTVTFVPGGFGDTSAGFVSYTPTLSCFSGALGSAAASGSYAPSGYLTWVSINTALTTIGTCSGGLYASLPTPAVAGVNSHLLGREGTVTGKALLGYVAAGGSTVQISDVTGAPPLTAGWGPAVSGFYATQ